MDRQAAKPNNCTVRWLDNNGLAQAPSEYNVVADQLLHPEQSRDQRIRPLLRLLYAARCDRTNQR